MLFRCAGQQCAFRAADITEVVPLVELRPLPGARSGLYAGVIDYRGEAVAVADLGTLLMGQPAQRRWSSRILIVRTPQGLAGFLAEGVSDTCRLDEDDFVATPAIGGQLAQTGRAARLPEGLMQCFSLADLLPLLAGASETAHAAGAERAEGGA